MELRGKDGGRPTLENVVKTYRVLMIAHVRKKEGNIPPNDFVSMDSRPDLKAFVPEDDYKITSEDEHSHRDVVKDAELLLGFFYLVQFISIIRSDGIYG